jgi:GNAT superfamily N-acetyltransferase
MNSFIIEKANKHDMEFILTLAGAEGWNPGLDDAVPFYEADPDGFFIGKLGGKKIGCISAVAYDNVYGFMGLYIVLPEYRGQGYGWKLWQHAVEYLGDRCIGLDGVVAQQENYKKSGFIFFYNNIRFGGKVQGRLSKELCSIKEISFQSLLDFDTRIFGVDRARFLHPWIQAPHAFGFAKMIDHRLAGYGWIRRCGNGYKIGPLFAENKAIANEIFLALAANTKGSEVFLDVVQTNKDAMQMAQEHHLNKVFETARMYKGKPPKQRLDQVFGVTTFELG